MYKSIYQGIKRKESIFFLFSFISIAFFFSWGNTSLGILLMIFHIIYLLWTKRISSFLNINDSTNILIYLLLLWGFFTALFAYNKTLAFLSIAAYALMVITIYISSQKLICYRDFSLKILLPLTIIGISISALYTIIFYFTQNIQRSQTFFIGSNGTGTLLTIGFAILLGIFEYINDKKKYILLLPISMTVIALLLTYSRGALLGFLTAFSFYNLRSKKHFIIFLIVLILILGIIFTSTPLKNRFISIFSLDENKDRINIWKSTINIIKDHLFLGIGSGNYPLIYPEYKMPDEKQEYKSFSHNIFSNIAAETGIIGLIIFTSIIIIIMKKGFYISSKNPLYRGIYAAFIGTLVHEQFDCTTLFFEIGGIFWLIVGLISAIYFQERKKVLKEK
jgi:O-antigen ligase